MSSFGLSGTNAHVVIEQAPDVVAAPAQTAGPAVTTLVVSGKTPQRVASWASVLADWMEEPGAGVALADVAHTLNHHRPRHGRFATVCARDRAEAVAGLRALAAGQPAVGVAGPHEGLCGPGVVFVYSGQGSQWTGMGQQLLADEPAFSAAVAELEPDFVAQTGFSLQQTLAAGQPVTGIAHIQPVVVGMQLALTALWRSYGVSPDAVIGHSMGEVSAAVVAGALTPADGLQVIATRSQLMSRLSGQGAMALLELDATDTEAVIADHPEVSVAVHASPRQTVIAGPPEQVDAVIATVAAQDRLARRIDVDVASHHRIIDPVLAPLRQALSNLMPRAPTIPVLSTTYDHADTPPVFDANHWADNLRHPVRFHQAITQAAQHHHTFIEISPHPLLTHAITETVESVKPTCAVRVTSAMNRDQHETVFFHTQLAEVGVIASGVATGRLADIPHPPWQHSTFWVADRSGLGELKSTHPLLGVHMELPSGRDHVWQADVGTDVCPWLSDHKVHGQPILPAAAFIEIALAAGSEAFGLPAPALSVTQLEVEQMLPIDGHTQITTQLHHGPDGIASVEVCSRSVNGNWRRHAVARVAERQTDTPRGRRGAPVGSWDTEVSPADFYATLRKSGQHHGPAFTALTRIVRRSNGSSETEITLPEEASRHPGFRIHPVMLDAALQSIAAAMSDRTIAEAAEVSYLPVSFEEITVFGCVARHARCHAEVMDLDGGGKLGRVIVTDDAGNPAAELTGIYLRRVERRAVPLPLAQKIFDTAWAHSPALPEDARAASPGSWLVLTDDTDVDIMADEFAARWRSPIRRVITAKLADESAVLAAFAECGADAVRPPAGIVVFVGGGSTDLSQAVTRARDSIWSICSMIRGVVAGWHERSPRLWLVTRRGLVVDSDETGDPAIGALKGLIRVLAYEHPDLRATLVDQDGSPDDLETLIGELCSPELDDVVAWRSGRRHAERLSRATLKPVERQPVVKAGAAYVVTGGLGGLGMVVARWLVDGGAGRIVLNGRNSPSDEHRKVLAGLEGRADIAVVTGDIAMPGVADGLVAAAEESGLELRGVVHAAAVIDDSLLVAMSRESLERVWAPKAARRAAAARSHGRPGTGLVGWVLLCRFATRLAGAGGICMRKRLARWSRSVA